MEEDASHAETGSSTGSTHAISPQQQPPENLEIITPSLSPSSAPSSPSATGTLSRLGLKSPTSPPPAGAPPGGQVSAITVVALLDKLKIMLESVQDNQQRMEQRQAHLENAVRVVQGDVTRLSKVHVATSNSVSKLLERSHKVSGGLKEVKERLDRQAVQVKKLEANHSHLLKRNHFKVIISQDDNEIPTSVVVKDSSKTPLPSLYDAESIHPTPSIAGSVDPLRTQDEALQTVSLSSDEDLSVIHREDDEMLEGEAVGVTPIQFERRADRFKRNSLKKVDSLKKAFTRQSFEKKMAQITTKIVPPEKREKIKKSLTPNHPKSPTSKSSSFKVAPMTFTVKKVRAGETPTPENVSPKKEAHVQIPVLGIDGENSLAEVHTLEDGAGQIQETLNLTANESPKAEVSINGKPSSVECELNGEHLAGLAVPEQVEDGEDEEEEERDEEKQESADETTPNKTTENETTANDTAVNETPVNETTVDAPVATGALAVEQVS